MIVVKRVISVKFFVFQEAAQSKLRVFKGLNS